MKATLMFCFGFLFTVSAMAQGIVNFANNNAFRMTTNSGPTPPPGQLPNVTGVTQLGFTVGLYIAPQGTTDPNAFTLVEPTTPSRSGVAPGTFDGNGGSFFAIPNNTGQAIAFQVRAWFTAAGSTYAIARNVINTYLGTSAIGEVTPTTGLAFPPSLFGTSPGQVGGFVLFAPDFIPEPSVHILLLVGLGFGLIVLKRSRHRQF